MYRQRFQIIALLVTLCILLFVAFFGPDPKSDINRPISAEEIAEWAAEQDTGAATEDYKIVAAFFIVPVDTANPYGEAIAIDLLSGEACTIPAEPEEPVYY